jgi:hypothetical protein
MLSFVAAGEHAARSAQELLAMARQTETKIGLLEGLAHHLNAEYDTTDVSAAIDDPEYNGICTFLRDELWAIFLDFAKYAKQHPTATLRDKPEFVPLLDLLKRCGKNCRLANVQAEVKAKVTTKTLTHDQRRLMATTGQ